MISRPTALCGQTAPKPIALENDEPLPDLTGWPPDSPPVQPVKPLLSRIWKWIKRTVIILFIAQLMYIILLRWVDPPITTTQLISWIEGNGLTRDYVPLNSISSNARLAIIASEDQLFPYHNGFDYKSIQKAMKQNKKSRRVRGASTLSQQVSKNVFLWQGRSWIRKGLEVYFTFMIEVVWGKRRILEMYLNVSEMGRGVFGVEAAARKYFKKPAAKLNINESAMIASCLPNPKKYTVKPLSNYVAKRYPQIVAQMNNLRPDKAITAIIE